MTLSIIIVSWNVLKDLCNCLDSIKNNPPSCSYEVILIDNASTDNTVEIIKKKFTDIITIKNNVNRGFAATNNQGIKISKGELILFLNPDTITHPKSIDSLVDFLKENPEVGACAPLILNEDGSIQYSIRNFPTFRAALYRFTILKYLRIFKKHYRKWRYKHFCYDQLQKVNQLMGAAMLIRKTVLDQCGYFDENFFMYYEEVDLCKRIIDSGWNIVYLPHSKITHLGGKSSDQIPAKKQILAMCSMLCYFKKHSTKTSFILFSIVFKILFVLRNIVELVLSCLEYLFFTLINADKKNKALKKIKRYGLLNTIYLGDIVFKI